jgi:hypothetical protein
MIGRFRGSEFDELSDCDRNAVLLRFFENRRFAEIASVPRLTEDPQGCASIVHWTNSTPCLQAAASPRRARHWQSRLLHAGSFDQRQHLRFIEKNRAGVDLVPGDFSVVRTRNIVRGQTSNF